MIDTYTIGHYSGPCRSMAFPTTHLEWSNRGRIQLASGERIRITLYGHGADLAQDVTGSGIHEWITKRGRTKYYPDATPSFGSIPEKGYVTLDVRAARDLGLGNRTITVVWLTGTEQINLKIVEDCTSFSGNLRKPAAGSGGGLTSGTVAGGNLNTPNLLPFLKTNVVLARPLSTAVVSTTRGGMRSLPNFFAAGLLDNVVTPVAVPTLTWGITGVNIENGGGPIDAQLIDVSDPGSPRVIDTLTLPQGFPLNTPVVSKNNYPGRPTSIRVVKNPLFTFDQDNDPNTAPLRQTFLGCFTEPGSTPALDPMSLMVRVDAANRVVEGTREDDNELRF